MKTKLLTTILLLAVIFQMSCSVGFAAQGYFHTKEKSTLEKIQEWIKNPLGQNKKSQNPYIKPID